MSAALAAFQGIGIELEFMTVDRAGLDVRPVADRLLRDAAGAQACDVDRGVLGWSNELVAHVIEIKNQRPVRSLQGLPALFQEEVRAIDRALAPLGARLMPGAMHPWMDPRRETVLWPHANAALYRAYAAIFDCNSHGWANLQSMHINLPFAGDAEFARLHAAIRLVLPILPALAASSPFADGADTGFADFRMQTYCTNADAFASIAGQVVPEPTSGAGQYQRDILEPMYRDIAPHDPAGLLRHEWLNSRGAIPRFDRNTIEIRVIDTQECVQADLAIAAATVALVRRLYDTHEEAAAPPADTGMLAGVLQACLREGERAVILDRDYLAALGCSAPACSAQELWRELIGGLHHADLLSEQWRQPLQTILSQGPLARRLLRAAGPRPSRPTLHAVYQRLCDCLLEGRMFEAP